MIEQTKFLGMPLKTQKQRRLLVVMYYGVLVGFAAAGLWVGKDAWGSLVVQTFVFGGLLGGIKDGRAGKAIRVSFVRTGHGWTARAESSGAEAI